jgi:hypothetical protein
MVISPFSASLNGQQVAIDLPNGADQRQLIEVIEELLVEMKGALADSVRQSQIGDVQPATSQSIGGHGPVVNKAQQNNPPLASAGTSDSVPATGTPPTNSEQDVINGDATQGASMADHAPAGFDLAKIKSLDGGLLGKTGNQELKGKGTEGIQGSKGILDLVAKEAGGKGASDLNGPETQAKRDEAWRMLEVEEQAKNAPQANGKQASAGTRHNGNLSGLQGGSDEVASDSDLAFIQNAAKGNKTKGGPSNKMNGNDGETTGAQQVGQKILDGLGSAAKWIGKVVAKVVPEFAPEIKAASAGMDIGLHAAGAAADKQDAGEAAKKAAEDELNPANLLT